MKTLNEYLKEINNLIDEDNEYLLENNIEKPNTLCLLNTHYFLKLLIESNIKPNKISTSVEGGLCFRFFNEKYKMWLEIYNDYDFGYLLSNKNENIEENKDLYSIEECLEVVKKYFK